MKSRVKEYACSSLKSGQYSTNIKFGGNFRWRFRMIFLIAITHFLLGVPFIVIPFTQKLSL